MNLPSENKLQLKKMITKTFEDKFNLKTEDSKLTLAELNLLDEDQAYFKQLFNKASLIQQRDTPRQFAMDINEREIERKILVDVCVNEIEKLRERHNLYHKEFRSNSALMSKLRGAIKKLEDDEYEKRISKRENELTVWYNFKFMPIDSKIFVVSKIKDNQNLQIFLSSLSRSKQSERILHDKSFDKTAKVALNKESSHINIALKDIIKEETVSISKLPIYEIFSALTPENLFYEIIPPVYLIVEFDMIDKGYDFMKDEVEFKFQFSLDYEMRVFLMKESLTYILNRNDKFRKIIERAKERIRVFYKVFSSDFYEESKDGLKLRISKRDGMLFESRSCGFQKCSLI